jgi:hypothetical protein
VKRIGGVALLAAAACVDNGDAGDAAAQGTLGGPCFPNNMCNGSLVCGLVNGKGVCQEGDASVQDAPADTTTSDAPADVKTDASDTGADACTSVVTPKTPCATDCVTNTAMCCLHTGNCVQTISTCTGAMSWEFQMSNDCKGSFVCASGVTITNGCPPTAQLLQSSQTTCQTNNCQQGEYAVCLSSTNCPPNLTCVGVQVSGVAVPIGFCM